MSIHRLGENADTKVASLTKNKQRNKHSDGGGLYLQVTGTGAASWVWRHKRAGDDKETWRSIGPASVYKAADAREIARKLRLEAHEGRDPFLILSGSRARPVGATFGEWLVKYCDKKQTSWGPRERRDHEREFGHVPEFCALPISAINQAAKNAALDKLGKSARRKAKVWMGAVIKFATTGEVRERSSAGDVEHFESMLYSQLPALFAGLPATEDARALRWTILTGARTDEVIGAAYNGEITKAPATWGEIADVDGKPVWVIQKDRMKADKMHRVPLSEAAVALLGKRQADNVPLFKVSSQNGMLNTLKRNGGNGFTVHGMRASFSAWATEQAGYDADLVDMCIAHETRGKVRKAYQRGDMLERRAEIMERWAEFLTGTGQ